MDKNSKTKKYAKKDNIKDELAKLRGVRLKEALKKANMKQCDLADLLGYEDPKSISRIVNGVRKLTDENARIAAKFLRVDAEYLLGEQDYPNRIDYALSGVYKETSIKVKHLQAVEILLELLCDFKHEGRLGYSKRDHNKKYAVKDGEKSNDDFIESYKILDTDHGKIAISSHEYYRLQSELIDYVRLRFNSLAQNVPIEAIYENEESEPMTGYTINDQDGTFEYINTKSSYIVSLYKRLMNRG